MISTGLPYLQFSMNSQRLFPGEINMASIYTTTVGNVKIALPENIALLLHPHVDVLFRGVLSLRNLTLDGKLYLRDDKIAAFV